MSIFYASSSISTFASSGPGVDMEAGTTAGSAAVVVVPWVELVGPFSPVGTKVTVVRFYTVWERA